MSTMRDRKLESLRRAQARAILDLQARYAEALYQGDEYTAYQITLELPAAMSLARLVHKVKS